MKKLLITIFILILITLLGVFIVNYEVRQEDSTINNGILVENNTKPNDDTKLGGTATVGFIASTSAVGGTGNITTGTINTSGANFLIILISSQQGTSYTISDSKSNTWRALTLKATAGTQQARLYYATTTTKIGASHTFTITGSNVYATIYVQAFSNVSQSSTFDKENGASGTGTSIQPGSVTPANNNALIISGLSFNQSSTMQAINSGFTRTSWKNFGSGNNYGGAMAYLIQTTAAAVNPTWSNYSGGDTESAVIAVFNSADTTSTSISQDSNIIFFE